MTRLVPNTVICEIASRVVARLELRRSPAAPDPAGLSVVTSCPAEGRQPGAISETRRPIPPAAEGRADPRPSAQARPSLLHVAGSC